MSKTDTMVSLDPEDSAHILEMVDELSLETPSPNAPGRAFGSARKPSLSKAKEVSQRDSQTLPWKNPMRYSNARKDSVDVKAKSPAPPSQPPRSNSPDIETILAKTPRPRKQSTSGLLSPPRTRSTPSSRTSPSTGQKRLPEHSLSLISDTLLEDGSDGEVGGSESDSSIDIHTPLPHLMFRDGLLSPRSKLLPQSTSGHSIYSAFDDRKANPSVLSLASTAGSVATRSGLQRDPRDTERRRVRHRDGRLLKAGMGLTTGLGWSDSEDEDAPSTLTRRLIASTVERRNTASGSMSRPLSMFEPTTSRITSPVPSASSRIPPRASHSNLRSASVSFPAKSPSSPIPVPSSGLRMPRERAASAASFARPRASKSPMLSPPPLASSPELEETLGAITEATLIKAGFASPTPDEPASTNASSVSLLTQSTGRSRAESSASTTSMVTTTSFSSVPPSSVIPKSSRALSPARSFSPVAAAPPLRARTESTGSNMTTETMASTASNYSQNSSSTSVPSSSCSGHVPRPLRLPQQHVVGAMAPSRSFSQDPSMPGASILQRPRTFSNPQAPPPLAQGGVRTTSNSVSSGVLPPGAPPTLRQRPTPPGGARPRPRTGTGMVYRTSSYSSSYTSFYESGSRMRDSSAVSP